MRFVACVGYNARSARYEMTVNSKSTLYITTLQSTAQASDTPPAPALLSSIDTRQALSRPYSDIHYESIQPEVHTIISVYIN